MAKIKLKAKTFNDKAIELYINIMVGYEKKDKKLSKNVYESAKSQVKNILNIDDIDFYVVSKELEDLDDMMIKIDDNSLIESLVKMIVNEYKEESKNSTIITIKKLYDERKYTEAMEILKKVKQDKLSKFDFEEYKLLEFKLNDKKDFDTYKYFFQYNPQKLKEFYFYYIKYLEDIRNETEPKKVIKEFEKIFPIDELNKKEFSIYSYLKGREFYYRGEYLLALNYLHNALQSVPNSEQKLWASIYNTLTNIFTDNLYFDEALVFANRAKKTREELKLSEISDTYSLIGGIYYKRKNYKKAYGWYKKSLESMSEKNGRIYNYLAKSAIGLGYFNKAKEYIDLSKNYEDKKGFLYLVKGLYFYRQNNFTSYKELLKEILPIEKKFDKIVRGWLYTMFAKMLFDKNEYDTGVNYLFRAVDYFYIDKYIIESFLVSLYPKALDIPKPYQERFEEMVKHYELDSAIKLYTKKHTQKLDEFLREKGFGSSSNNLLELFNEYKKENYNIIDKYNLL